MKRFNVFITILFTLSLSVARAQQGINGSLTLSSGTTIVNEYTAITGYVPAGSTSITVANSNMNANGRFGWNLRPGDLVMIYQPQGVWLRDGWSVANQSDTSWGAIVNPWDYNSAGRYELHQVVSVPNLTTINIDCGTTYTYYHNGDLGGEACNPEVIRVPRYINLTINAGATLSCDDWNGTIGGILAVETSGDITVNGTIDATGKGFRGGALNSDNATSYGSAVVFNSDSTLGAARGEGVAGYMRQYNTYGGAFGGSYCRGAAANAGGGGDGHNAGGGGGANAPNGSNPGALWSGNGIPDQSGAGWTTAWNLEPPVNTMSLRTAANSAGGGRGGYSFSSNNRNATTTAPGNALWGGDSRNPQATGLGGRPLDYSGGRLFMGGGGGAGDQNNGAGGNGGDGGGLIYLMSFGNINGTGTIVANGNDGGTANGIDAAGGGGAGGTIVLNAVSTVANTLTVNANGGNGGNQNVSLTTEAEGPGGGGGGGYIAVSSGAPVRNANGGNNGTTNSLGLTEFLPNGATKGCPGTSNGSITNFTISATNVTICAGGSTTLTATLSGTVPGGTTIIWYDAATAGTQLGTGSTYTTPALGTTTTYYVTTCPGFWRIPVTVTVGPPPTVTASASSPGICTGGSTTLTASGATTYTWMPGNLSGSSVTVTPGATTTYTVTGSNGPGCSNTASVTVTVTPPPTLTVSATNPTICNGSSTTLNASGATSYTWMPGNLSGSSVTVSPTSNTTYTVTGTTNGCSSNAQVTVTVNPTPTVTATAASPTICAGSSTSLTGSGATSYTWMPGSLSGSPVTVTPASTTTYTVTGTDGNGCSSTGQVTVTVNPLPVVSVSPASTTICSGNNTTLTASGGTTYTWMPGSLSGSSVSVSPSITTTYTVTGTTSGCTNTASATVTVNPTPTVTATASASPICIGSPSTLTASGATTYTWMPGNLSGSSVTVTPATTTTYTVTGTSAGCTSTAQVTVTVNPSLVVTATASSSTLCDGTPDTLTSSGATNYTWNPGNLTGASVIVTPSSSVTYTVTGDDGNGCTSTAQVSVTVNPSPTVTVTPSGATICSGSSTTLTASGGTTYTWMPGNLSGASVSVSPSSTTTFTVTGTSSGCSDTAQSVITVNATPAANAGNDTAFCSGGSVTITATGGGTYVWNGGTLSNASGASQVVSPSSVTTYTVDVTAANGCSASDSVVVSVNALPAANAGTDQVVCSGTVVNLSATGGGSYSWNGGSLVNAGGQNQSDAPSSTTNYVVTVTDPNGCSANDTVLVSVNALPNISAGPDLSVCPNSTAQLSVSGGTLYTWMPGSTLSDSTISNPVASPTVSTTYVVTGTDANGCSASDTVTVNVSNVLSVNAGPDVSICQGDTIQLSTSGGTTYVWSPASSLTSPNSDTTGAFPASTTTYVVNVTDANNCSGSDSVTVFVNPPVTLTTAGATTICIGQSATISATPSGGNAPYTFTWSNSLTGPGPQTVSPVTTTTYSVSVTDSLGCSSTQQTVTVNVNPALSASSASPPAACSGTPVTLNASATGGDGNYSYTWLPSSQSGSSLTFTPSSTTTVSVVVTDGCGTPADTTPVAVTVNALPVVTAQASFYEGCGYLCVDFTGQSTGNCASSSWTFGDSDSSNVQNPSHCYSVGTYDVSYTCTDNNGCTGTATMPAMITVYPPPTAAFTPSITSSVLLLPQGSSQQICFADNSTGATSWSWAFGTDTSTQQSPCFTIADTGMYCARLAVSSQFSCPDTARYCFDVVTDANFSIPNVFTPNGDGVNDMFMITGTDIKGFRCEIYDRWGVKIYEWNSVGGGWDGKTTSGADAVDGVYYYVMSITDYADNTKNRQGFVQLIRGK